MGITRSDLTMVINETVGNATEMIAEKGEGGGLKELAIFAWVIVALFIIINIAAIVYTLRRKESKYQP